ncbi:MAG: RNA polymerase sigma factor [Coriobacteriales bacterium]|nr:RNA polymerase sigma factor [Coriobacteriales bacterium]
MVFRIAFHYLRSSADADDICQDAFVALYRCGKQFEDDAHLKAWLIKTTCNLCKSEFRKIWRRSVDDLDTYVETLADPAESGDSVAESRELLGLVMKLPKNQRITIYLHYYEGYEAQEIAEMLGKPASTIRSWLARGRMRLARKLGEGVQS